MRFFANVNTNTNKTSIIDYATAEQLIGKIAEFRITNPTTPIEIFDENGKILVNENRDNLK